MLPLSEVQRTFYAELTIALSPVPVLDQAGPDQQFPYVTIGESITSTHDTLADEGVDVEMTVHTWSRQRGYLETQQLMQTIKSTLHYRNFTVQGFQWVTTVCEYAQTLLDADGLTRHGVLRFRVVAFQPEASTAQLSSGRVN